MNKDLYLIPLILAWMILAFVLLSLKAKKNSKKISIDRPFKKDIFNELYNFSFQAPFKHFLPEVENKIITDNQDNNKKKKKKKKVNKEKEKKRKADEEKKRLDTEMLLNKSGFNDRFNYRSFTVLKLLVFFSCIVLYFVLRIALKNMDVIIKVLFNVANGTKEKAPSGLSNQMGLIIILLVVCLMPQLYLKFKAKSNANKFSKDIPIIQLFITLMLRSNMSVNQILYVLSRTNTMYREIFELGYRIYIRDNSEGLSFLQEKFRATKFEDTILILCQTKEYSKGEVLHSLENNMEDTIEYLNNRKRTADISKVVYSQASMVFPFISVMLFALAPVAIFGLTTLTQYT